jgi:hypothetical protein
LQWDFSKRSEGPDSQACIPPAPRARRERMSLEIRLCAKGYRARLCDLQRTPRNCQAEL